MSDYKKEDLKFYKMKKNHKYVDGNKVAMFDLEGQLSIEEKIKFIDSLKDNVASYLLDILSKWEKEKGSLPKDSWGEVKTVSKKAWIKRNDERKIIDTNYKIGYFRLFGTEFVKMSTICPRTEHSYNLAYTGEHIVNQWFHDLCSLLYREEEGYFKEHDPFQIKLTKLRELGDKYSIVFDSQELNDIVWNRKNDVDEIAVDQYLKAYERLGALIKQIEGELKDGKTPKED